MTLTLEIPDDIGSVLTAAAERRGMTIEEWLPKVAMEQVRVPGTGELWDKLTPEEWVREFHAWSEGHDRTTPLLSDEAISRESIYPDFDLS